MNTSNESIFSKLKSVFKGKSDEAKLPSIAEAEVLLKELEGQLGADSLQALNPMSPKSIGRDFISVRFYVNPEALYYIGYDVEVPGFYNEIYNDNSSIMSKHVGVLSKVFHQANVLFTTRRNQYIEVIKLLNKLGDTPDVKLEADIVDRLKKLPVLNDNGLGRVLPNAKPFKVKPCFRVVSQLSEQTFDIANVQSVQVPWTNYQQPSPYIQNSAYLSFDSPNRSSVQRFIQMARVLNKELFQSVRELQYRLHDIVRNTPVIDSDKPLNFKAQVIQAIQYAIRLDVDSQYRLMRGIRKSMLAWGQLDPQLFPYDPQKQIVPGIPSLDTEEDDD